MYAISQRLIGQIVAMLTALCSALGAVSAAIEYRTVVQYSYECLDVLWVGGSNNVTVQQCACHGATEQWRFVYVNNDSIASGKCLDITHGDTADAVTVRQNTYLCGLNQ